MCRISLALVLLLAALPCSAAEKLVLVKTKSGHYHLTTDAAGKPKLEAVEVQIVDLTDATGPEVPAPPPPVATEFEKAIAAQTAAVLQAGGSKTTAAGISAAYSLVSGEVAKGSIPQDKAFEAVKAATDAIMAVQPDKDKWTTWRTDLGKALTTLGNQGLLDKKEQVVGVLKEISRGIDLATGVVAKPTTEAAVASADTDGAADGILEGVDLQRLMELIRFVMQILKLFGFPK